MAQQSCTSVIENDERPIYEEGFIVTIFGHKGYWRQGQKIVDGGVLKEADNAATSLIVPVINQVFEKIQSGPVSADSGGIRVLTNPLFAVRLYLERVINRSSLSRAEVRRGYAVLPGIRIKTSSGYITPIFWVIEKMKEDYLVL